MKQFFKMMFASAFGTFLALGLVFLFIVSMLFAIFRMGFDRGPLPIIETKSILHLELEGNIPEKTSMFDVDWIQELQNPGSGRQLGLLEIKQVLEAAKDDEKIAGLYLNFLPFDAGWATLESIKKSIDDFKEKGKFIIAYGEIYTEKSMFLAASADETFIYPQGLFELNGLGSTPIFFKNTLEKLEIEPIVFKVGQYKSAVESFSQTEMSEASERQLQEYLNSVWQVFLNEVGKKETVTSQQLDQWATNLTIATAEEAQNHQLIKLSDEPSVFNLLKERAGAKTKGDLPRLVNFSNYLRILNQPKSPATDPKLVAVLYVTGEIIDGYSTDGVTGSRTIVEAIRQIKENKRVKAVVLRVNSPGGSALASDVIMNELNSLDEKIPVIASFGDVAASGGYYVAAQTDYILAQSTTLTGSIGVFGVLLNTKDFFNNKLGVTFDRVVTNPYADTGTPARPMTQAEKQRVSAVIDHIYERFLNVVLSGRKLESRDAVHAVAQGRIWSGQKAQQIGLVDEIGGLDEALDKASELTQLGEDYYISVYPQEVNPFAQIFGSMGIEVKNWLTQQWLTQDEIKLLQHLKQARKREGAFMRMPFDLFLD